ncbi:restriction endonuclease subunit S [Belliella sp. DSM 107340]|uniref:Restriction endonuclease subunit S n=1 Tax=Belliella calami TaxID=2923436 RepID=A0ABS9UTX5_9BACT|nr:restriction endonuclease subunit S [Belliella calami]MCH7400071.1 restriction endonuclease subunit S [Belliella calami]
MELTTKKGYKQTEVGLIPEDWDLFQVIDLIDLLTDYDANGSFASVAENVKVFDYEKFAWYVRSTDLENNSKMSEVRYVDEVSYKFLKKTALYGGELLFLKRGDIGNVYRFEMKTKYATVAPNLYLLKLNEKSNSKYLYYFFTSKSGQLQLKRKNASSTLGALYKDDVKSIYVPLPPTLIEQKAIATALSDVDELIGSLEQLITKKKAIKQGAMQQLLTPPHKGGKRLDGFEGVWVEKKLGDVVVYKNGAAHENCVVADGDYVIVNSKFVSTEGRVAKYSNQNLCPVNKDEILMVLSDIPNGKAIAKCYYVEEDDKYTLNQRICSFKTDKVDSKFLFLILNRNPYYLQFDDGVKQTNLRNEDVLSCPLDLPPSKEEQKAIAQILSDMDAEITQLESKKEKYQSIKQGMMQELLTGKTRLI